jgi:putative ABC transport system permease protein
MWRIIFKSLRQHWLSTGLAILSIALGVGLLVSVVSLREQAHNNFTQVGLGVDAVLGPKGSPLQIVLNAIYNLEEMPGKIPWPYYQQVLKSPFVVEGIPFCTGHSYAGFRVNAIDRRFLTDFEYLPGQKFSFNPADGGQGRAFNEGEEAVAGWSAAHDLGIKLGDTFNPTCGVHAGDPVHIHDNIKFVGVMARTGTPYDRVIYIPLLTFYTLEGHGAEVQKMAVDEQYREISGAFLKIKRIAGGAIHPGIMDLKYEINQAPTAQFVVPNEVLPKLFTMIGWVDNTLLAISIMVIVLAGLFLLVALASAMRERRRDIALMRALGATRTTIFGLVVSEAVIIAVLGGIIGLLLGHAIVAAAAEAVRVETGLRFSETFLSQADWFLFPAIVLLGLLSGLIPAVQAYRTGVLKNLTPIS